METTHDWNDPLGETIVRELKEANEKLVLAGLRAQELAERARKSEEEVKAVLARESLLAEASALLGASRDYNTTLQKVARLAVPKLADWCVVDLVVDGGTEQVASAHADVRKEPLLHALGRLASEPDASFGVGHVLRTGRSDIYPDVSDGEWMIRALGGEHPKILRELGARSYMCVPLIVREEVIGVLSLVSADSGRRFREADLELAEELARRSSWAIDNARLYREAQIAIEMRDDVLAVVSHDLRNPLGSVLMGAEMMLGELTEADSRFRKPLEIIRRSADHMRRMIDELMELASIQVRRLVLERSRESLSELVDEVVEMLEPAARKKSLRIEKQLAPAAPLACDKERIVRVITNLVSNAIKFTPDGGQITVRTECADGEARVAISDTGPGIAKDDVPKLFEPYWKGKRTGRKGTGLGLYIAKGIVQAHGGRIWVDTETGAGSTFCFSIPME